MFHANAHENPLVPALNFAALREKF